MVAERLECGVDDRRPVSTLRARYCGLEIVGDDRLRHPTEKSQRRVVCRKPVCGLLRTPHASEGEIRGWQDGHEEFELGFKACTVVAGRTIASVVDHHRFTGSVSLDHDRMTNCGTPTMATAESSVRHSPVASDLRLILSMEIDQVVASFDFERYPMPVGLAPFRVCFDVARTKHT